MLCKVMKRCFAIKVLHLLLDISISSDYDRFVSIHRYRDDKMAEDTWSKDI